MDALMQKALSQGLGYALFVVLLFYVLKQQEKRDIKTEEREKKSEEREAKYQEIITELSQGIMCKVDKVVEKVEEILRK